MVQLDFGDARSNEFSGTDPYCILDIIRRKQDSNSTKSIRLGFEGNAIYSQSQKFFSQHIQPTHILAVIEKLKQISEENIWQIAYIYTYGNQLEKKVYADCLIAKIRSFISLEPLMQSILQNPDYQPENFSKRTIRSFLAQNHEYRSLKEGEEEIFSHLKEFIDQSTGILQSLRIAEPEIDPKAIKQTKLEKSDSESQESEISDSDSQSKSSKSDSQNKSQNSSDSEENSDAESLESEISGSDSQEESDDSIKFGNSDSESESEEESDDSIKFGNSDSENESEDESLQKIIADKINSLKPSRDKILEIIDNLTRYISTPIDREEEIAVEIGSKKQSKTELPSQIEIIGDDFCDLYRTFRTVLQEREITQKVKDDLTDLLEQKHSTIKESLFSFFTHYDSYKTFNAVREVGFTYSEARNQEINVAFAKIGIDITPKESPALAKTLERIKRQAAEAVKASLASDSSLGKS